MSPFGEDEIEGLVDEVEEIDASAAAMAAAPVEEGAWMGVQQGDDDVTFADESSTYGSSVPIEDLLTDNPPESAPEPASEPTWRSASASRSEFEVDRGFDPEWTLPVAPPMAPSSAPESRWAQAESPASIPSAPLHVPNSSSMDDPEPEVLLTEVASDDDLFSDPSLEIAHLADGQAREIIVPVMLGEGPSARRYKLAIRLRLDAVD
jgi:hypothetical protein